MFLEFLANQNGAGDIVALGAGDATQTDGAQVPHDLILDRIYIHGDPVLGQKRGLSLNSRDTSIYFQTSGPQTIRLQQREDGIPIDQIVLSSGTYLSTAPKALKSDATIVPNQPTPHCGLWMIAGLDAGGTQGEVVAILPGNQRIIERSQSP